MRFDKQISRNFYKDAETGDIFCIEKRWDRVVLGSCGPLPEDNLKDPADYECTDQNNLWIQEISGRLILM
jgi:hypothetical protein